MSPGPADEAGPKRRARTVIDVTVPAGQAVSEDFLIRRADQAFRHDQSDRLLGFFKYMNAFVVLVVIVFWMVDEGWIPSRSPGRLPLITERVVIALIAGSVAQLGAVAVSIARGLFSAPR